MNIHFSQRGRRWDSLLFPVENNQFELTIQCRVHLVRIEPGSHFTDGTTWMNGKGVVHSLLDHQAIKLDAWDDLEWETYKREFKQVLERNWNERFRLVPNKAWYASPKGTDPISVPVRCSLAIQVIDSAALHPHFTFRCLHPQTSFRSYVSSDKGSGIITHEDVTFSWIMRRTLINGQRHRVEFGQITVLHEFGHVLGFDHVNGGGNDDGAYGITLDQRENLMGMGHHFASAQARPWRTTLRRHLVPENRYDRGVTFTGQVDGPQLIAYWDNDWDLKPTPKPAKKGTKKHASSATGPAHAPAPTTDDLVYGPGGVVWKHMAHQPPASE